MPENESKNRYDQRNIDTMELVYGRGYLSAGGDAEVARVLDDIDLKGRRVLDLGFGLGGALVTMARDLGATGLVGFDIDESVLARARLLIEENQVDNRVELVLGQAGPLQFSDEYFDIVYMTAVACHMSDLAEFFREVARVLKTGGRLVDHCLRSKMVYNEWVYENNLGPRPGDSEGSD